MNELSNVTSKLPKEAWNKIVDTACDTFEKLIYPLTASTEGIGRLIERRFDQLEEEQKILAAKCLEEAAAKVKRAKQPKQKRSGDHVIKPAVVYEALNNADNQTDQTIRSLWANLLANEFMEGDVHPEIAKILGKITSHDALLLHEIAQYDKKPITVMVLRALASASTLGIYGDKRTFNHVHLKNLDLIQDLERTWCLTTTGREFMRCVSEPKSDC